MTLFYDLFKQNGYFLLWCVCTCGKFVCNHASIYKICVLQNIQEIQQSAEVSIISELKKCICMVFLSWRKWIKELTQFYFRAYVRNVRMLKIHFYFNYYWLKNDWHVVTKFENLSLLVIMNWPFKFTCCWTVTYCLIRFMFFNLIIKNVS